MILWNSSKNVWERKARWLNLDQTEWLEISYEAKTLSGPWNEVARVDLGTWDASSPA